MADNKRIVLLFFIHLFLFLITINGFSNIKPEMVFKDNEIVKFIKFIKKGNIKEAEKSITNGFDINSKNENGVTPLYYFFLTRDFRSFKSCLELGANPNIDPDGVGFYRLIDFSMRYTDTKYFKLLLTYDVDLNYEKENGKELLNSAMYSTVHIKYLKMLLENDIEPKYIDSFTRSPLLSALIGREYKKVKLLLEYYPEYLDNTTKFKLKDGEKTIKEMFIEDLESYTQFKGTKLYYDQLELVKFLKDKFGIEIKLKY